MQLDMLRAKRVEANAALAFESGVPCVENSGGQPSICARCVVGVAVRALSRGLPKR